MALAAQKLRQLHGQIARLFTLQDSIDVVGGIGPLIDLIDAVAKQAAITDVVFERINRRQAMQRGQLDDGLA